MGKMTLDSSFYKIVPLQIRNELAKLSILPEDTNPEKRAVKTIAGDSTISPLDSVQTFFIDTIDDNGKSKMFTKEIASLAELSEESLSLLVPQILFKFSSPDSLKIFAQTFAAHVNIVNNVPELHIELDFTDNMKKEHIQRLSIWEETELPHGRDFGMRDHVQGWFQQIALLPELTTIHVIFTYIWMDFRALRGVSKQFGIYKREVTFQFPTPTISRQDYNFFKAQTIAAVKNIKVPEQVGIERARREALVNIGCTGFNGVRWNPAA